MSGNYIDITEDPNYREGFEDGRKEGLLESCLVTCPECAKDNKLFSNDGYPNLYHVVEGKGAVDCPASAIHKLRKNEE